MINIMPGYEPGSEFRREDETKDEQKFSPAYEAAKIEIKKIWENIFALYGSPISKEFGKDGHIEFRINGGDGAYYIADITNRKEYYLDLNGIVTSTEISDSLEKIIQEIKSILAKLENGDYTF